jgi:diguanylate cyclase (GGDEF)-like protein/PAS domain S-box-containing protein
VLSGPPSPPNGHPPPPPSAPTPPPEPGGGDPANTRGQWDRLSYEASLANSPIGQALVSPEGHWLWVNQAVADLLGREPAEVLTLSFVDVTHPDDRSADAARVAQMLAGECDRDEWVKRYLRPDGTVVPALLATVLVRDADGRPLHFVSQIVDLRPLEAAEGRSRRQEELMSAVLSAANDYAIMANDATGVVTLFSAGAEQMLGYSADRVVGKVTPSLWHVPEEVIRWREEVGAATNVDLAAASAAAGRTVRDVTWRRADGTAIRVELSVAPLRAPDGSPAGNVAIARDVTAERRRQEQLDIVARRAETQLGVALDGLGMGTFDWHVPSGRYVVNGAYATIMGLLDLQPGRDQVLACVHPDDRGRFIAVGQTAQAIPMRSLTNEFRVCRPDGTVAHVRSACRVIEDSDGRHLVGVLVDETAQHVVSERLAELLEGEREARADAEDARAALAHQVLHDPLTALPNRILLLERLNHALAQRPEPGVAQAIVIFCDLDHFKIVNDSLGHAAGDLLLKEAASRLQAATRGSDLVARLGGDEFVVLVERMSLDGANRLALRVLEALRRPYSIGGRQVGGSASVGVAIALPGATAEDLLRDADAALYVAKAQGRDRMVVFDETIRRRAVERLDLESELGRAVEADQLFLEYQPVMDRAGRLHGLEALVRWQHPERGRLEPEQFIGLAEETRAIVDLGRWVRRAVAAHIGEWRAGGRRVPTLWLNVSALEVQSGAVLTDLLGLIASVGLEPHELGIELTESAMLAVGTDPTLAEIRTIGVQVALDDFGTGYSSLAQLRRHRVDALKIDRTFVAGLPDERSAVLLVRAVLDLASAFGAACIAEGVETGAQYQTLVDLGCDRFAGHLLARPLSPEDVALRLEPC